MSGVIPDWLENVLIERERERQTESAEAFGRFSDREQRLIREAAVMGFVRGSFCAVGEVDCPRDRVIVANVMAGALSQPDNFLSWRPANGTARPSLPPRSRPHEPGGDRADPQGPGRAVRPGAACSRER